MASTRATTRRTVTDAALPGGGLPVDVTTTAYTQDATTPNKGAVTVALTLLPSGASLNAGQVAAVATDIHTLLGWTP